MSRQSIVRGVLVGCGPRGLEHARALSRCAAVNFVACCDALKERRDAVAAGHGVAAYGELETMLARESPDLVHIVTPPGRRGPLLSLLADASVPACIVEKPVALGVSDYRELTRFAEGGPGAAMKISVCLQGRYHPLVQQARNDNTLGGLMSLNATSRMNVALQGVHMIDRSLCLAGDPTVGGTATTVVGGVCGGWDDYLGHDSPSNLWIQAVLPGGAALHCLFGPEARRTVDSDHIWMHTGLYAGFEFGAIQLDEFGRWSRVDASGVCSGVAGARDWQQSDTEHLIALMDDTCRWAFEGGPPAQTHIARALDEWALVLAAYHSAVLGRPVRLDEEPPADLVERLSATAPTAGPNVGGKRSPAGARKGGQA